MDDLWNFLKSDAGRSTIALSAILVSASIAITIYLLNRRRKALVYEILSMTSVLTVKEELSGRVKILFDGESVDDVGLVFIRVMNCGTEPIRISDFVRPISFSVASGTRIIDAEITKKKPQGLEVLLDWSSGRLTIPPTLMNSKDELILKLLIANFGGTIIPDARIEGAEMKQRTNLGVVFAFLRVVPIFGGIVAASLINLAVAIFIDPHAMAKNILIGTLIFVLGGSCIIGLFGYLAYAYKRFSRKQTSGPNDYV